MITSGASLAACAESDQDERVEVFKLVSDQCSGSEWVDLVDVGWVFYVFFCFFSYF